jgi:serine/threonine protein kinase/WD40 repeat protein
MSVSDQPIDVLLDTALRITDARERQAWMESVCCHDSEKLEELRSLVEASRKTILIDTPLREVQAGRRYLGSVAGLSLGPFQLLEQIGVGGMGVVYLARQQQPVQRLVAVKLIQMQTESVAILRRFQGEQQTLANMEHPNIARIIDAGATESGFLYIAMEYVQGENLLDYCKKHQPDIRTRIGLMIQCCLAIQHAHQKGTIHRDIKPSNVMVTLVDGEPVIKMIDFGIAKAMEVETLVSKEEDQAPDRVSALGLTHTGVSLGTPPYMSPEQYSMEGPSVETRSDIYSLGALMYSLLTNVPPFDPSEIEGLRFRELRDFVATHDPTRPSVRAPHLAGQLRGSLDAIVLKAMSRNVEQRYESVGLMIEDLRDYLMDLPVRANPDTAWVGIRRFSRRHKLTIVASALALVGLLAVSTISIVGERRAMKSELQAMHQAYASDMLVTSMAVSRGNYVLPKEILKRHRPGDDVVASNGPAMSSVARLDWRLLASQMPGEPSVLAQFPSKIYFGLKLSAGKEIACGCKDSHLRVLDRVTGGIRLDINTQQVEINGLAISPDGTVIASGGDDGTVHFYDIVTGALHRKTKVSTASVFQIAWTPDGKHFLTVGNEANAKVWSLPDFQLVQTLDSVGEDLECLAFGRQGQVAFGSEKGVIRIGSFRRGEATQLQSVSPLMSRISSVNRCSSLAFSSDGKMLAAGLHNGYLILMVKTDDSYQIVERIRFPTTISAIDFNSIDTKLAIGENDGSVHVLELPEAWPTRSRLRFTKYFFDQNERRLPESSRSPERLWDFVARTEPPDIREMIPLDTDQVYLEFNTVLPDLVFSDNYLREWTDESGQTRAGWTEIPKSVIYKRDGIELQFENRYSGWSDFNSLRSRGKLASWSGHTKRVSSIVWDPSGRSIQSFSEDGSVRTVPIDPTRMKSLGGQDIREVLPLRDHGIAVITSDFRPEFLRLNAGQESSLIPPPMFEHLDPGTGIVYDKDLHLYFLSIDAQEKTGMEEPSSQPRRTFNRWNLATGGVESLATLSEGFVPKFLAGFDLWKRIIIVYEEKAKADNASSPRYGFLSWDIAKNSLVWKSATQVERIRWPTVSPNGSFVMFGKEFGTREICLLNAATGREHWSANFGDVETLAARFSTDERYLAVSLSDHSIICFRTEDGTREWTIKVPGSPAKDLLWSSDRVTLACVGHDGYLRTFDTRLRRMTAEILLPIKYPIRLQASHDEELLYVLDRDGSMIRIPCGVLSLP